MQFLDLFDLESLIRLLVAAVLGALVGLEREVRGRPVGLRTNALVCLARPC
jgi:putative Mg2+ transporter-C (MgtC) family protein